MISRENQQERLHTSNECLEESSTTTRSAPTRLALKPTARLRRRDNPDFYYSSEVRRWVRIDDGHRYCIYCRQRKQNNDFFPYTSNANTCKQCLRALGASRRYGVTYQQALELHAIRECQCCGGAFLNNKDRCIHHLEQDGKPFIRGVLCLSCNLVIQDESKRRATQLKKCLTFMGEDIV